DGDLDLVINNIDEFAQIYENKTSDRKVHNYVRVKLEAKQSEGFAKVTLRYPGGMQVVESKRVRGYLSSVEDVAHFGIGELKKVTSLEIEWPNGQKQIVSKVKVNRLITIKQADAKPAVEMSKTKVDPLLLPISIGQLKLFFKHQEDQYDDFAKEILLPYKQSSFGPCLVEGDVNGDGLMDLFIGGAAKQASALFIQTTKGFEKQVPPIFQKDANFEDTGATFLDYDNDGDQDLVVVSGGNSYNAFGSYYRNRLYENDNGNWVDRSDDLNLRNPYSSKVVKAFDFDKDGDQDLMIGNRIHPQSYPKAAPSFLLENKAGTFEDVTKTLFPDLSEIGIINQILVTDYDQDTWEDILIVGEWTGVHLFRNQKGQFVEVSSPEMKAKKGWWFNATEADLNNDGQPDYILGNLGLNSKFSASTLQPFKVYASDFDESGSLDIVLSKEYKGEEVPVRGRECSSQQMPFIKEKFPTFKSFAEASMDDIYGDKLERAINLEVTDFKSYVLINQGEGRFEFRVLPRGAQFFPMLNIISRDLNGDNFTDLILSGTIMDTEVETPRWDAGSGLILLNDQSGNFKPVQNQTTHFNVKGDIKSMQLIPHQGLNKDFLIIGRNNDVLAIYQVAEQ
ncbi:MAG: FG-GAP-like repeat-containing protein, partial [Bacteroidota bacterium]